MWGWPTPGNVDYDVMAMCVWSGALAGGPPIEVETVLTGGCERANHSMVMAAVPGVGFWVAFGYYVVSWL